MDTREDYAQALSSFFHAEKYHPDMVYDYSEIVVPRLAMFSNQIDPEFKTRLLQNIVKLCHYSSKPVSSNRVYIVCGVNDLVFANLDFTDKEAHLLHAILLATSQGEELPDFAICPPDMISTLYIFSKNEKNNVKMHLMPRELAYLISAYKDKNLIPEGL